MIMKQKIHRTINTVLIIGIIPIFLLLIKPLTDSTNDLYEKFSGIYIERIINSEIAQIGEDEGYRSCYYKDSLGFGTIGFGTLVNNTMVEGECIDAHEAVRLLRLHYNISLNSVEKHYKWAEGDTKLILVNLAYNMGETRLSKFKKMLKHLKNKNYDLAAGELLNSRYAKQVRLRAGRMASRIMAIGG